MDSKALTREDRYGTSATSGMQPLAEPPFVMPFKPGQVVGRKYEIIEMLGVGGVGFVVAANHIELGEKVALKFLKPEMLVRPEVVGRFAHEALAAVRIKSEHVARVFDVGSMRDGTPFIVMEYLEGRDLFDVISQDGPQPIRRAVDFVLQACEALADAHSCGVVHRDIKPENLFLLRRSEGIELINVLDFGISKLALTGSAHESKVPLVRTMLPMGSPVYMSPEQIRASQDIDCRTDIWSMGCVIYELLTGKAAFDAPSLTQLSATILEQNPPPPSFGHPEIPEELDAIVSRCLEKQPDKRFQNVAELAMALYPLGPRRAKVSAERCCLLLKIAGSSHAEFELPSVRPPGIDGLSSGAFRVSQDLVPPIAQPVVSADEIESFRPKYRTKKFALIAGGVAGAIIAAIVGILSLANQSTPENARVSDPNRNVPGVAAPHDVAKQKASPSDQSGANAAAPSSANDNANASETAISVSKLPYAAGSVIPRRTTVARPAHTKKSASGESPANTGSDPDPGF